MKKTCGTCDHNENGKCYVLQKWITATSEVFTSGPAIEGIPYKTEKDYSMACWNWEFGYDNKEGSKNNMKSYEEQIEYILKNFDFGRVHSVMEFLNWTWHNEGVPSHYKIIKSAEKLLRDCVKAVEEKKEKNWYIATGGFHAELIGGELNLKFVLEEWDGDVDDE